MAVILIVMVVALFGSSESDNAGRGGVGDDASGSDSSGRDLLLVVMSVLAVEVTGVRTGSKGDGCQ